MTDLGLPRVGYPQLAATASVRVAGYDVVVVDVGLACCAEEFAAALLAEPAGVTETDAPAAASVLVVSGTVTTKLAPAVRAAYDALPEPRRVISFGSCANSGGPYWDSYSVVPGVATLLPVDVFVPGCPPRPEAVVAALATLEAVVAGAS